MRPWRRRVAAAFAAVAFGLTSQSDIASALPTVAEQGAEQGFRAAAALAADDYRAERRRVLRSYREATAADQAQLHWALSRTHTAQERRDHLRHYAERTAAARDRAQQDMNRARARFRARVELARGQFGLDDLMPAASSAYSPGRGRPSAARS